VDVVTKSGSNRFHGGLFEFFRNTDLDANDSFLKGNGHPGPLCNRISSAVIFGGPLAEETKLFFFGSYQGTRQVNGLSPSFFLKQYAFPHSPMIVRPRLLASCFAASRQCLVARQ